MSPLRILSIAIAAVMMLIRSERSALAVDLPLDQLAVPHYDTWVQLPSAVIQELRLLVNAPQAEIDRLLASPDAREVGLGLFALEQRADLDRLVSLADLLSDSRPTIPFAAPTAGPNQFVPLDQTVGQYLSHIYSMWFGIPGFNAWAWNPLSAEMLTAHKEAIRNLREPWNRPEPWLQKMSRSFQSLRYEHDTSEIRDQRMAEIKAEIAALPSELRWAVVTQARSHGHYTHDEARAALLALDQSVREQIMTGDPLAAKAGQIGWNLDKDLVLKARQLLAEP